MDWTMTGLWTALETADRKPLKPVLHCFDSAVCHQASLVQSAVKAVEVTAKSVKILGGPKKLNWGRGT